MNICNEEKGIAEREKDNKDSDLLEEIATIEEQKAGVHLAMVDIAAIHKHPEGLDYAATVAMGFVLVANGPPSRPGELETILYSEISAFCGGQTGKGSDDYFVNDDNCNKNVPAYITRKKHKMYRKRGESGKYIAPGTKKCIQVYVDRETYAKEGMFLKPARASTAKVLMSKILQRGCAIYTPGKTKFCSTLRRKQIETLTHEDEDGSIARRCAADSNEHAEDMGGTIYRLRKAKSDAIKGRKLVAGVMEGAAPWPDDEDLSDEKLKARAEVLREIYTRHAKAEEPGDDEAPDDDSADAQVFAEEGVSEEDGSEDEGEGEDKKKKEKDEGEGEDKKEKERTKAKENKNAKKDKKEKAKKDKKKKKEAKKATKEAKKKAEKGREVEGLPKPGAIWAYMEKVPVDQVGARHAEERETKKAKEGSQAKSERARNKFSDEQRDHVYNECMAKGFPMENFAVGEAPPPQCLRDILQEGQPGILAGIGLEQVRHIARNHRPVNPVDAVAPLPSPTAPQEAEQEVEASRKKAPSDAD
jgi:hypothetical protein